MKIRSLPWGSHLKSGILNIVLLLAVVVATDFGLAQLFGQFSPLCRGDLDEARVQPRIASQVYHHDLAKNVEHEVDWGPIRYPLRTNSLGFRDASARTVPARSNAQRILFIGDSFTEGVGVAFEDTFVGIIAKALDAEQIEVLNAAVVSYSPAIYYRKVKYLVEEMQVGFDRLVVFLDISDIQDEAEFYYLDGDDRVMGTENTRPWWGPTRGGERVPETDPPFRALKQGLKANSVVICFGDLAKDTVEEWLSSKDAPATRASPEAEAKKNVLFAKYGLEGFRGVTGNWRALWTLDDDIFARYGAKGLQHARANMDRLADLARDKGIDVTLVVYPWPDQIANRDRNSRQVRHWRSWAGEREVRFMNLFPAFLTDEEPAATIRKHFIPGDVHWNEAGHRVVAESFLEGYSGALSSP